MPDTHNNPLYLPVEDIAARGSFCARTVRRAISAGELPGYKVGRSLRVRVDEFDAWLQSKRIPNARVGATSTEPRVSDRATKTTKHREGCASGGDAA